MATLTIRDVPDNVRDKLRIRAAENGRSMEAEVRTVLAASVEQPRTSSDRRADWDAAVREAQEAFAPYRNPKVSVVDELITDLRSEAAREAANETDVDRHHTTARAEAPMRRRETQAEKLERARAIIRRRVPAGVSLVDEFLAERRAMWGEE